MNNSAKKSFFASKTNLGVLLASVPTLLNVMSATAVIPPGSAELALDAVQSATPLLTSGEVTATTLMGAALAFWGRYTARQPISLTGK